MEPTELGDSVTTGSHVVGDEPCLGLDTADGACGMIGGESEADPEWLDYGAAVNAKQIVRRHFDRRRAASCR